jgi:ankyrin repeat protein
MYDADAFVAAIKAKDTKKVLHMLDEHPPLMKEPIEGGITPITLAAYCGAWDIVRYMTERGGINGLIDSIFGNEIELFTTIISAKPGAVNAYSADGWTPLHIAAYFGKDAFAVDLISRGADVNAWSQNEMRNQPLHSAIAGQASDDTIERLIAAGADTSGEGALTPMQLAVANGRERVVELLKAHEAGAKVGATV